MFENRRRSDYIQLAILVSILLWGILTVSTVAFTQNNGAAQQQFNARTETRLENIESHLQDIDSLKVEARLTKIEAQVETISTLSYWVVGGVGGMVLTSIWQVITSNRQRK